MLEIAWSNHINWKDPDTDLSPHNGFGYATERATAALRDLGYNVSARDSNADVQLWFDQPQHWEWLPGVYRIGYLPWESSQLNPGWLEKMNECDEIWTPSPLIARWYRLAGVIPPIYVYEHGVDPLWAPKKRQWSPDSPEPFSILHVGAEAARRAGKEAMQSIRLAFPRNWNVKLDLKIMSPGWSIVELPRINVINRHMKIEELLQLYYDNHLMLGISYGEGFGLTPLQGMATGMPVISQPDWAPYHRLLDPDLSIASKMVKSPWPALHPGGMLKPDLDELVENLRFSYNNYETISDKAYQNAEAVLKQYDWNTLTESMFESLEKRLKK